MAAAQRLLRAQGWDGPAHRFIRRQYRHRRQHQQLMPNKSPQPGYMCSDTHLRNPTA